MINETNTQPEALRLANRLENGGEPDLPLLRAFAAAELRSQHALIVELEEALEQMRLILSKAAQRNAMRSG